MKWFISNYGEAVNLEYAKTLSIYETSTGYNVRANFTVPQDPRFYFANLCSFPQQTSTGYNVRANFTVPQDPRFYFATLRSFPQRDMAEAFIATLAKELNDDDD